jgi:aerobic-type carbon monoxide dehydrogenase small subunit (CoxS/CutS family)
MDQFVMEASATREAIPDTRLTFPLTVNGEARVVSVEARVTLADVLRDHLGLTGTHIGCAHGVCGTCTVLMNGEAVRSCLMFAVQARGAEITTVEGLAKEDELHPLQQAFRAHHALQCGFCTPGFLMTLIDFLGSNPDPTEEEIRQGLTGSLCRCTGYQNIIKATLAAAKVMRSETMEVAHD